MESDGAAGAAEPPALKDDGDVAAKASLYQRLLFADGDEDAAADATAEKQQEGLGVVATPEAHARAHAPAPRGAQRSTLRRKPPRGA